MEQYTSQNLQGKGKWWVWFGGVALLSPRTLSKLHAKARNAILTSSKS